jgi:hypothetical protein
MKRTLISLMYMVMLAGLAAAQTESSKQTQAKQADPAAWNLLKSAREAREVFPDSLVLFSAEIVFNDNGRETKGKVAYEPARGAQLTIDGLDVEARDWLADQVNSLLAHRRNSDFSKADGRNPITFAADDRSPLGRRVELHDRMESSYRIKNNQVVEVDRTIEGEHFVITVLETTPTEGGKFLPRHFTVTYFDAKTGAVKRNDAYSDEYRKAGSVWVPASRRIVRAEGNRVTARIFTFLNPRVEFSDQRAAN